MQIRGVLGIPQKRASRGGMEEPAKRTGEPGTDRTEGHHRGIVEVGAEQHRAAVQPLENASEMRAVGALEPRPIVLQTGHRPGSQPWQLACHRQLRVGDGQVQERGGLEVERLGELAPVRYLDHTAAALGIDHERLVVLTSQIAGNAVHAEELARDRRDLLGRECRRVASSTPRSVFCAVSDMSPETTLGSDH